MIMSPRQRMGRSPLTTQTSPHTSKLTPILSAINAFKNYNTACGLTSGMLALKLLKIQPKQPHKFQTLLMVRLVMSGGLPRR